MIEAASSKALTAVPSSRHQTFAGIANPSPNSEYSFLTSPKLKSRHGSKHRRYVYRRITPVPKNPVAGAMSHP